MAMIEINIIKPSNDAVQAADKLQKDANNHLTWLRKETPGDSEQIRKAERALEDAREVYTQALYSLSVKVNEVINQVTSKN
ncbi:hypothetical protein [Pseudomonas putida]|uniref:hypothetical protein n=1 Tax=Pseudomonas putida TaxID=303 RepID=UPI0018AA6669|nr:hypothetical protein [Pseudomonas putida]MBF8727077.1 hypothetical protein [Pseudomonas putida]